MRRIIFYIIIALFLNCTEDEKGIPKINSISLIRNSGSISMYYYPTNTIDIQLQAFDDDGNMSTLYVSTYQGSTFSSATFVNTEELTLTSGRLITFNSTSPFRTASTQDTFHLEMTIIDSDGNTSQPMLIQYVCSEAPTLNPSAANHDYGNIVVGTNSSWTLTLTNGSTTALIIFGTLILSGTDTDQYSITTDNCTNQTITAGGNCTVDIRFEPTSLGVKNASLIVPYNHLDSPTETITLTGAGI